MADLLAGFEVDVREEHVPDQFRAVVQRGWIEQDGAQLLAALYSNYSGAAQSGFEDVVQYEATVNGRGMMDYDLPSSGPERSGPLLNRTFSYACTALLAVPAGWPWPILAYVSLSEGGLDDDLLTAHVTFCSRRPGLPPFVQEIESYTHEALMEISRDDAKVKLARTLPSNGC
ncbi:hypothetical protein [Streptomyces sp. NRRL B-3229]|uniref:hypothetical protein n=1 Tax=Streptomyces sp. NRRL B-3229 TaxID=1463836 RepID=UPI001F3432F3|nr:hypothetical protein [Streptomyces sp. NRRL B-3229]